MHRSDSPGGTAVPVAPDAAPDVAIEAKSLSKRFGDVQANDAVSLSVQGGTVHGIVGENGAGKSTLLKMLFGFYRPDGGTLSVRGRPVTFHSPADAMAVGVGMVHQHFMLVEPFTVLENIILGVEGGRRLDRAMAAARENLHALEQRFGFDIPLDVPVAGLPVGVRQRAEILKALYRGADILILDEPTAVLTPQESDQLFALIRELKGQGKTVLFVTHKLDEIMAVTDRVTVMRAGRVVADLETVATSADALAEAMVGTRVTRAVVADETHGGAVRLSLENVSCASGAGRCLHDVSFDLHDHEVLGIAGVAGNGQTELLEVITGLRAVDQGRVLFSDVEIAGPSGGTDPVALRRMGMAHVPEDRLKTGVVESMTARENIILGYQREEDVSAGGTLLKRGDIAAMADRMFAAQDVRPRNPGLPIGAFSGGNQQKIVIARELARQPALLVIGQPTRGVDIGAVTRIHDQIIALRNAGRAVLVVSADLDELIAISDRIAVMAEGRITGILPVNRAEEKTLGLMMAGRSMEAAL